MGGAKSVVLNSVLVFTFVALWHDLTFRLLAWGWLVSLFIIPELLASSVLPASKVSPFFSAFRPRPRQMNSSGECPTFISLTLFCSMINAGGIDMCARLELWAT